MDSRENGSWITFVPHPIDQEKKKNTLPEGISLFLFCIIGAITFYFAYTQILTPLIMGMCLMVHLLITLRTNFNIFSPSAFHHFYHSVTGIGVFSMIFAAGSYYFTYIFTLFGANPAISQQSASFCIITSYLMLLWATMASISILGIYFAIFLVVRWFPYLVSLANSYNVPFILYIIVALIAVFAMGGWFTHIAFVFSALFKKEGYGELSSSYYKISRWIAGISLITGIVLILVEPEIFLQIIKISSRNL